jgi:hypothetical protein
MFHQGRGRKASLGPKNAIHLPHTICGNEF